MMNFIRRLLGKVLPPNRISFTRGMRTILSNFQEGHSQRNTILNELREEKKRSEIILAELKEEKQRTETIITELREEKKRNEILFPNLQKTEKNNIEISDKLKSISSNVPAKELYFHDSERKAIKSFNDITSLMDFKDKFLALIRGMDENSIESIIKIIKRQQLIRNSDGKSIDLYSRKEQDEIKKLKENFESYIFKISEDLYCYKQYLLPINYFESCVFYYKYGLDLIENPDFIKDKDIIDVGAYIGDSTILLAPLTNKKVYSFEPVDENYKLLLKTLAINNLSNVITEKIALGSNHDQLTINCASSCSSVYTPLSRPISYQEKVQSMTLDNYIEQNSLEAGLIKVDIEGFEQEFLKGAEKTIKRQKPILLISIYHNENDFFNIKPWIESWDLGYKFKIYKPTTKTVYTDTLLIAEVR